MSQPSLLLKYQPVKMPRPEMVPLIKAYKDLFTEASQPPSTLNVPYPLKIDPKEALTEVAADKIGFIPKKNFQKQPTFTVISQSGLSEPEKKVWYYQAEQDQIMGPFTAIEIDRFLTRGQITTQTKVALETLNKFVRIETIIKKINDAKAKAQTQQIDPQPLPPKAQTEPSKPEVKEPFRLSGLSKDLNEKIWYFKQGNLEPKGPFATTYMDSQWQLGVFTPETLVGFDKKKLQKLETYLTLGQHGQVQQVKEIQEKIKQKEEEDLKLELDYSQIKQNINLGSWGQPLAHQPIQVKVSSAIPVKKEPKTAQGQKQPEGRKRSDNKSMHVEGDKGNLYVKKGFEKKEIIYETKEEAQESSKEIQEYLKKLAQQSQVKQDQEKAQREKQHNKKPKGSHDETVPIPSQKQQLKPSAAASQAEHTPSQTQPPPTQAQPQNPAQQKQAQQPVQQQPPQQQQQQQPQAKKQAAAGSDAQKPAKDGKKAAQEVVAEQKQKKAAQENEKEVEFIEPAGKKEVEKDEEDGWQIVGAPTSNKKKKVNKLANLYPEVPGYVTDGKQPQQQSVIPPKVQQKSIKNEPKKAEQPKQDSQNAAQLQADEAVKEEIDDGWVEVKPTRPAKKK